MFLEESWAFEKSDCSSPMEVDMPEVERYEILVIGSGEAGKHVTWTFAQAGHRTAVVERKYIGGSCPNIACLPSKNIIHSAKVASYFRRSKEFGITLDGFAIDMADVRERKRRMVRGLNDMYMENYRNTGAEFILGTGRFLAQRTVEVTLADWTTRQLRGANVIVSTGTRAALEAIPGLAEAQPLILNEMMVVSTNRNGGLTAAETAQIMVDVNNLLSTGATALIRTAGAGAVALPC